jgi:hypothetical protein
VIFRPELAALILSGEKTVTRRPVTDDHCRYEVGKTYAVQPGRGKHAIGRLRVTNVRRERFDPLRLGRIEVQREGFRSLSAFLGQWALIYGRFHEEVWRIEFEVVR